MLLVRLLALLGLLLLAPVAQAAPGPGAGSGLIDIDALVEGASRLAIAEEEADGGEGLAQAQQPPQGLGRPMDRPLPPSFFINARHRVAQPRAPPF